MAISHQRWGAD